MNHDATHCADYRKSRCPKRCYRAQLTQDLIDNWSRLSFLPASWSNFRQTKMCPLHEVVTKRDIDCAPTIIEAEASE